MTISARAEAARRMRGDGRVQEPRTHQQPPQPREEAFCAPSPPLAPVEERMTMQQMRAKYGDNWGFAMERKKAGRDPMEILLEHGAAVGIGIEDIDAMSNARK